MNEEERLAAVEQIEQWQVAIGQLTWELVHRLEEVKELIDSDYPYYVNLLHLRARILQIQQLLQKL